MFSNNDLRRIREITFDILDIRQEMENEDILPGRWESLDIRQAELLDELKKIFDNQ